MDGNYVPIGIMFAFGIFYVFRVWQLSQRNRELTRENHELTCEVAILKNSMIPKPTVAHRRKSGWVPKADREPSDEELASVYESLGVPLPPSLSTRIANEQRERDDVLGGLLQDLERLDHSGTDEGVA